MKIINSLNKLSNNSTCFLIAEVGLAHEGSLGMAFSYIDAAAKAGVNAIKFQTHLASEESSNLEKFRLNVFPQDKTRYDYWERTSFNENQWLKLKIYAESKNLIFMSSPFSIAAVNLLRNIGIEAWKIGSGETNNLILLEEIVKDKKPIFLSTGMSFMNEVFESVNFIKSKGSPLTLLQCTNLYPCPPEKLGLDMINEYQSKFGVPVGFSDHSGEIYPAISAYTLGARTIEVHVTFSKQSFGPDVKASLTFEQLSDLVKGIRFLEKSFNNFFDKDVSASELLEMRKNFTKGLFAKSDIKTGEPIHQNHLVTRKPCIGIKSSDYKKVIGKASNQNIKAGEPIYWEYIDV